MTNEIYQGLIGGRKGRFWWGVGHWDSEGTPGGVGFDYKVVMYRQREFGDIVGFYHTHPNMGARPSSIDYNTMGTWTNTFGKPLVCCIRGVEGVQAHWFIDDETAHITGKVKQFGKIFVGIVPKKIRDLLEESHGE